MSEMNQNRGKSSQYLTFTLRNEAFGVEIGKVREILDIATITRVPKMPACIRGVINLRGQVVPVMDIGYRLGMPPVEFEKNTCIMIVETDTEGETVTMGTVADSVQMVVDLPADRIEAVPQMGTHIRTDFISGMGRHEDNLLILLNLDRVLTDEETQAVTEYNPHDCLAVETQPHEEAEPAAAMT